MEDFRKIYFFLGWFVGIFMYLKIAFSIAFDKGNIMVCLVISAFMSFSLIISSNSYYKVIKTLPFILIRLGYKESAYFEFIERSLKIVAINLIINILFSKLLILAFDKSLNRKLGGGILFQFDRWHASESLIAIIILSIPILAHYVIVVLQSDLYVSAARIFYDNILNSLKDGKNKFNDKEGEF